jgi:acyl-CoA reductase-like NAD-dependent aldehyde dehydrogenase
MYVLRSVFNLVHGIDEEATWARVAAYERENKALIAAEQTRRAEAAARAAEALERERAELERARAMLQVEEAAVYLLYCITFVSCAFLPCVNTVTRRRTSGSGWRSGTSSCRRTRSC